MTLDEELRNLLNRHNVEVRSDTPDFILARFMLGCLDSFSTATTERDKWYGFDPSTNRQVPDSELTYDPGTPPDLA